MWSEEDWSLWVCWQDAKRLGGTVVSPTFADDELLALERELQAIVDEVNKDASGEDVPDEVGDKISELTSSTLCDDTGEVAR